MTLMQKEIAISHTLNVDNMVDAVNWSGAFIEHKVTCSTITLPAKTEIFEMITPVGKHFISLSYDGDSTFFAKLNLPAGWSYRVRILPEALGLELYQGQIKVIQDNLGNVYARVYQFDGQPDGKQVYELVDMAHIIKSGRGDVWVTYVHEDEATLLDRQVSKRWFVNTNVNVAYASRHTFLKSPSLSEGQFRMSEFYGKPFAENAMVLHWPRPSGRGLLQRYTVRKFHELTFLADMVLPTITDPHGYHYLQFDVPMKYGDDIPRPPLPKGWTYQEYLLTENFQVDLFGDVKRLLSIITNVGYQGPFEAKDIPGTRIS